MKAHTFAQQRVRKSARTEVCKNGQVSDGKWVVHDKTWARKCAKTDRCQTPLAMYPHGAMSESRAILDGSPEIVHNYARKCIIMQST
ncbi:MAG: hypothetical protein FWD76_06480 [Firmicutes bacterium]|nr:hypothetical protein [Bacillota bacterium]